MLQSTITYLILANRFDGPLILPVNTLSDKTLSYFLELAGISGPMKNLNQRKFSLTNVLVHQTILAALKEPKLEFFT